MPVSTRPALQAVAGGPLGGHPLGERHLVRGLRVVSDLDLGEDGNRGEGREPGRTTRSAILRISHGGAGTGRADAAQLVVCAVIENGGHGSSAAAPAALRVFEKYFNQKAPTTAVVNVD